MRGPSLVRRQKLPIRPVHYKRVEKLGSKFWTINFWPRLTVGVSGPHLSFRRVNKVSACCSRLQRIRKPKRSWRSQVNQDHSKVRPNERATDGRANKRLLEILAEPATSQNQEPPS